MSTVNKKYTPAPRLNALADQVKDQRFALITKAKALREQRSKLKGVKGTGQQWAELSTQIDEVQAKIDMLSKSLGLPVKDRITGQRRDEVTIIGANTSSEKSRTAQVVVCKEEESLMVMNKQDLDAWDDYQSSPEDFK